MAEITTTDVNKISAEDAGGGSTAVEGSIAQVLHEMNEHMEGAARWLGASAGNVGPGLITSLTPFILTSDATALTYGAAVVIFTGAEDYDLPFTPAAVHPHLLSLKDVSNDGTYKIRFANSGWDGTADTYATMALAVAAKKYTEVEVVIADDKKPATAVDVHTGKMTVGSTLWAQVMHDTASAETIEFTLGIHGHKI